MAAVTTMQELSQDTHTPFQKRRPSSSSSGVRDDASAVSTHSSIFGLSWDNGRSNEAGKGKKRNGKNGVSSPSCNNKNGETIDSITTLRSSPKPKRETSFLSRLLLPPSSSSSSRASPKKVGGRPSTRSPPRSRSNSLDSVSEDSALAAALYQGDDMDDEYLTDDTNDDDDTQKKRPSLVFAGLQHVVMNLSLNDETASGVFSAFTSPEVAETRKEKLRVRKELLLQDLDTLDLQLENAKLELQTRQEAFESVHEVYQEELDEWSCRLDGATKKWLGVCHQKQLMQRTPLHTYVSPLRRASCPNYIVTMESQVCQSVHHICMMEDQKAMQKKHVDSLGKWMMAESERHQVDKSRLQSELLRRKFDLKDQIRQFKKKYQHLLEGQKEELEQLEATLWKRNLKDKEWVKEELFTSSLSTGLNKTAAEYNTLPSKSGGGGAVSDIMDGGDGSKSKKSHRRNSSYGHSEVLLTQSRQSLTPVMGGAHRKRCELPSVIPEENPRDMDLAAIVAEAFDGIDDDEILLGGGIKATDDNPLATDNTFAAAFAAAASDDDDDDIFKPPAPPPRRRRHRRGATLH